jgi:hypothetical protein
MMLACEKNKRRPNPAFAGWPDLPTMKTKISDFIIGAIVSTLAIGTLALFLMRGDDCQDKARDFVRTSPLVTAKAGKVVSIGTSSWLSGQAAAKAGQRTFYFLVKGERAAANAIVSADRASCTSRLESIN